MAHVDPDALANHELARVYIAGTLSEAQQVEALLTGEYEVVGTMVDSDGAREIVVRSTFKVLDR